MRLQPPRYATLLCALAAAAIVAGCGNSPTSPTNTTTTTTTTTTTVAEPTINEVFQATVPVGGSRFYSFTVTQNGTVNLTLVEVAGQYVPATVTLGLGVGVPDGTDCNATTSINTAAGTTPQVTATLAPGIYCARVYDVGNLFAPAAFSVSIDHP